LTTSTDLGAALEAFILEHEYCGELIQPKAVIPSHVNEAATTGSKVNPGRETAQFIDLVKGRPVHLPLSGRTMQFEGNAKCLAGC